MGKLTFWFLFCCLIFFLGSCSYHPILKGEFEAEAPQNFVGVGKELPQNSTLNGFTVSGVYVPNIRMHIDNLYNVYPGDEDDKETKGAKVNFWYELDKFPVTASYTRLYKAGMVAGGFSLNVGKNFFGRFIYGLNQKNYEVGIYGDIGYGFNKSEYIYLLGCDGSEYPYRNCEEADTISATQGHFVSSFGSFVSLYYDGFGFTYSPMAYGPWRATNVDNHYKDGIDLEFDFPLIISHYVGVSFWLMDHWKFTGGASFLHAWEYEKFYVIGNASVGYWF